MYSTSYHVCASLFDATFDYKAAGKDYTYSDLVAMNTKVKARWSNMVSQIISAKDWETAQTALANSIKNLKTLGHTQLYEAQTLIYKKRKADLGITYGYPLNDPNYVKKEISEGGRYTWTHNGKEYVDIWGARGDINYYYDYIIV